MQPYTKRILCVLLLSILSDTKSFITVHFRGIKLAFHSYLPSRIMSNANSTPDIMERAAVAIRHLAFANPNDLVQGNKRIAKDEGFVRAVQHVWKSELTEKYGQEVKDWMKNTAFCRQLIYNGINSNTPVHNDPKSNNPLRKGVDSYLYGSLIQPYVAIQTKVPGIVLFHTGAGPNDIFMYWKADSIIASLRESPVVLVADLVSDQTGECWENEFWSKKRDELMTIQKDQNGKWCRLLLQYRINAAIEALKSISFVDETRIGVMGWCLGGRAVSELARMNLTGVKCAVSFHGVVDGGGISERQKEENLQESEEMSLINKTSTTEVILFNGLSDPFVSEADLLSCSESFNMGGVQFSIKNFPDTRHGFTNPAQDLNPHEGFAYNESAAKLSWSDTIEFFNQKL